MIGSFWQPLSEDERSAEEARTREFLALLALGEERAAFRAFNRYEPPPMVREAFTSDPIVLRLLVYSFHPRRDDTATWTRLRPYVTSHREALYFVGLQPSLMAQGIPPQWCELVTATYYATDYVQRSKERGDARPFAVIEAQYRDQYLGRTDDTDDGAVNVRTMPFVGGGAVVSRLLTRPDGTRHEEIIFDLPHEAVAADDFREYVDQTILRRIQQFAGSPADRDEFFAPPTGFTRVMKLVHDGDVIFERPMHLTTNYTPLIARFTKQYVFERGYAPDRENGSTNRVSDREVSEQEVLMALFECAMVYQQDFGFVPGFLHARMRDALTGRVRAASVSHEIDGQRRLASEIEHSGDAATEEPSGLDDSDAGAPNAFESVDNNGQVHLERNGARSWTDDGLAQVARRELLEPLNDRQRAVAVLLMNGLSPADAARSLGISRPAVTQMMKRIRRRLSDARPE